MSTTGHYTRYINQYPGWSDNCDTMFKGVYSTLLFKRCDQCQKINGSCLFKDDPEKKKKYCSVQLGHFTVEHNAGNTNAYWVLCWDNPGYNFWQWLREQQEFNGPYSPGGHVHIIDYTGKKAIQNVLDKAPEITESQIIDIIFRANFYNRSYSDYFRYYLFEVPL